MSFLIATPVETAQPILAEKKSEGQKIVFTNGCFDIIHSGHVRYLLEARSLGDFLVIGLNSDQSIQRIKGPTRPIVSEYDRAMVLMALKPVDMVVVFQEDTPVALIQQLEPDIYVKGGDYTIAQLPEFPVVKSYGGQIRLLSFFEGNSTTRIVERILDQNS